jgi:hypothetical protein
LIWGFNTVEEISGLYYAKHTFKEKVSRHLIFRISSPGRLLI